MKVSDTYAAYDNNATLGTGARHGLACRPHGRVNFSALILIHILVLALAGPAKLEAEASLDALIDAFIARDPGYGAAQEEWQATMAESGLELARAGGLSLSAGLDASSGELGPSSSDSFISGSSFGLALSAVLPLGGGEVSTRVAARRRLAEARLEVAKLERTAYFLRACVDLVEARALARLAAADAKTCVDLHEAARAQEAAGAGTSMAVLSARQELAAARARLVECESRRTALETDVEGLLGKPLPEIDFEELLPLAAGSFEAGPVAREADARATLARADRAASNQPLSLDASASILPSYRPFDAQNPVGLSIGLGLSLALAPGFSESAKAARASLEASDARALISLVEARRSAERAKVGLATTKDVIALLSSARDDSTAYLAAIKASFLAGASPIREVLDATAAVDARERSLVAARAEGARAAIAVAEAVGIARPTKRSAP